MEAQSLARPKPGDLTTSGRALDALGAEAAATDALVGLCDVCAGSILDDPAVADHSSEPYVRKAFMGYRRMLRVATARTITDAYQSALAAALTDRDRTIDTLHAVITALTRPDRLQHDGADLADIGGTR